MKEGSHFNVTSVTTVVLARIASKRTLNQFMKKGSHSNVSFVITNVPKKGSWRNTWYQHIKKQKFLFRIANEKFLPL